MEKEKPRGGQKFLSGCVVVSLTALTLALVLPTLVWALMMGWVNQQESSRSDQEIVWDVIGPSGPGYANLEVLKRQGDRTSPAGLQITFSIQLYGTTGPLQCQGTVTFVRGDPNRESLSWDDSACGSQYSVLRRTHELLGSGVADAFDPEVERAIVLETITHWIEIGAVRLDDVRNYHLREWLDEVHR